MTWIQLVRFSLWAEMYKIHKLWRKILSYRKKTCTAHEKYEMKMPIFIWCLYSSRLFSVKISTSKIIVTRKTVRDWSKTFSQNSNLIEMKWSESYDGTIIYRNANQFWILLSKSKTSTTISNELNQYNNCQITHYHRNGSWIFHFYEKPIVNQQTKKWGYVL